MNWIKTGFCSAWDFPLNCLLLLLQRSLQTFHNIWQLKIIHYHLLQITWLLWQHKWCISYCFFAFYDFLCYCWCNFWCVNASWHQFVSNDNIETLQLGCCCWTFEDAVSQYLISSVLILFFSLKKIHAEYVFNNEKTWLYTQANSLSPVPSNHDENQIPSDTWLTIAYCQMNLKSRFL